MNKKKVISDYPKDFFNEQKDNRYLVTSLGWNDQIAEGDNSIHIIGLNDTNNIIYILKFKSLINFT